MEAPPAEEGTIQLVLAPFWEIPVDADGFGTPVPLDGVTVCVKYQRPHEADRLPLEEAWRRFVDTGGPCTTTAAGERIVLTGAPAMSEVILIATKPGFASRAIAVTTGQWDQDASSLPDGHLMHLFSESCAARLFPNADLLRTGQVVLYPLTQGWSWEKNDLLYSVLGGVSARLEPARGDGPVYGRGGIVVLGATATLPGDLTSVKHYGTAAFTNVPEGEYALHLSDNAPSGTITGASSVLGYFSGQLGVVRVPVLAGYFIEVASLGGCRPRTDSGLCAVPVLDAGSREGRTTAD